MTAGLLVPQRGGPGPWAWRLPGLGGALAWLQQLGLGPGDRLTVTASTSPALVALLQAAAVAGIELVLTHARLPPALSAQQAAAAGGRLAPALPSAFPEGPCPTDIRPGGALLLHTSGTTGPARRVRLPWDRVHAACAAAAAHLKMQERETWLACLPLDHAGGAALVLRAACAGTPMLLRERFTLEDVYLPWVQAASLVPTLLHRLVAAQRPLPQRPRFIIGGAPLDNMPRRAASALGARVRTTYGLTETCAMVACQTAENDRENSSENSSDNCGPLIPGWELRLDQPDSLGRGRIQLRGPGRCAGYDGDATADASASADPQSWLHTGDWGRMDAGRIQVLGRADEVIISGGEKIAPSVVEAILLRHPALREVAVIGEPDAEWGQRVVAIAVAAEATPASESELTAWCRDSLAPHQVPRAWRWVASLPRNDLGKLQRQHLR